MAVETISPFVAEFVGTFVLVFTAGSCSVVNAGDAAVWNATAIAAILMVMVYAFGPVSGGHFNPSVSMACGFAGKMPWARVWGYVLTQIFAGLVAGFTYTNVFVAAAAVGPKHEFSFWHVCIAELIYTTMLCFVVLNCACSARNNPHDDQNHFFGLAIGFVIIAGGYAVGDISGALFNPAVTIGIDANVLTHGTAFFWVITYIIVQILASALAASLFLVVRFRELTGKPGGESFTSGLEVKILAAHRLRNADSGFMGDVSDPFVTIRVGDQETRTPTIDNNLNPVWTRDNEFSFALTGRQLTLDVMNANVVMKQQSLGTKVLHIDDLKPGQLYRMKEPLLNGKGAEIEFEVKLISQPVSSSSPSINSQLISEFIGTFFLVLTVGLNVVMKSPATAWSAAAALMSMIYSLGDVSGAHFNPSVTLAVVLSRRGVCTRERGVSFIVAQLAAGVCAGAVYSLFHRAGPYKLEAFALQPGVLSQGMAFSWLAVFCAEMVFTGMLAFVVLSVATTTPPKSQTAQNFQFALAIGSCVTAGGFAIGAVSGGSLNPAVSFGLATGSSLNSGKYGSFAAPWYYCCYFTCFELAGGVAAALLFHLTHSHEFVKAGS